MKDKRIGNLILKGCSLTEIRKEIPNFPENPTKEYFMEMGYKENTAKQYVYRFRKTSRDDGSVISIEETTEEVPETHASSIEFITSEKPDYNNLLVDTCALSHDEIWKILENAQKITVVNSVIEEMDRKKNSASKRLKKGIKDYIKKSLHNSDKYMLSSFSGCFNEKYPDNILLQYMQILPKQIRPTLITADKILALKAKALGLEYILYVILEKKVKDLGYGVQLVESEEGRYIQYKGDYSLYILRNGSRIPVNTNRTALILGDSLFMQQKVKGEIKEHAFAI